VSVGWGEGESVGRESGRRIVALKAKKKDHLDDADHDHMRKVIGYAHRHLAQGGPKDDTSTPSGATRS